MGWVEVGMSCLSVVVIIIGSLVGVAFLTLFERKILGYIQFRKGPNKLGVMGVVQPFSDAVKLFSSEQVYPLMSNFVMYLISPIVSLIMAMLIWLVIPYHLNFISLEYGVMMFLCILSVGVYSMMIVGWSANSNYSMLGCLRSVAQTISYEVSLVLVMVSFLVFIGDLSFLKFMLYQEYVWFLFSFFPLVIIFFISIIAEVNRSPFDFAEGESELVSGFNVEYMGVGFALIFLAEYMMIMFMSLMFSVLFMGSGGMNSLEVYVKSLVIMFIFMWIRGTLPRFRYDKLMYLAWKSFLPMSLNLLIYYYSIKLMFIIYI